MKDFDLEDLKARINPQYYNTIGTESYERRLCADEIESLRARVAELEAGAGEPVPFGFFVRSVDGYFEEVNDSVSNSIKLYGTPQPTPTVQAAVAAALLRKAAEVCEGHENMLDQHKQWVKKNILAIPHDDSALREICLRVAEEAFSDARRYKTVINLSDVVDRVLKGE